MMSSLQIKQALEADQRNKDNLLDRLRVCDAEIARAQLNLKDAQAKAANRSDHQRLKVEAENEKNQCQERLEAADKQIRESEPMINRLRKELRDILSKYQEAEAQTHGDYNALISGCDQLQRAITTVQKFRKADTKAKLRTCEGQLKELDSHYKEVDENMNELRSAVSRIEKEENDSRNLERNVNDNIKIRELKEKIVEIEIDIEREDFEGATKARRQFDKDYEVCRNKLTEAQASVGFRLSAFYYPSFLVPI